MHSFTCAGMLEVQYTKFCMFAGFGAVGHHYIKTGTDGDHVFIVHQSLLSLLSVQDSGVRRAHRQGS